MKKGFTLIEMLVVIGIIAILIAATTVSYSKLTKGAEKAKAQELVSEAATALTAIWDTDGIWPKRFRETVGESGGVLDKDNALVLAKRGGMSFSAKKKVDSTGKITAVYALTGKDRFGLLTPWAARVVGNNESASLDTKVGGAATVQDHILHFAVDLDGDGIIRGVDVGGETINIRASAAVWCIGKSGGNAGQPWPYSTGLRKDDVYSWTVGQTQAIQ